MRNKSQSTLEYSIVLGIIIVALSAMTLYFRRGIQSVIKVASDEAGNQKDAEEIDPLKGTKTASSINRKSQMTQTSKVNLGNERVSDFSTVNSVSGTSTSISTQEK